MASRGGVKSRGIYDVHPGVAMVQKWIGKLKEKTGHSLEEWMALIQKDGPADERGRRAWLKTKHKLGTNGAWWLTERAGGKGGEDDDPEADLRSAGREVQAQYSWAKENLRPIYDELLRLGKSMGADVKA